jgi:hypothetical protein
VKLEKLLKNTPLTRRFAPRRPMETLKLRVSAQKLRKETRSKISLLHHEQFCGIVARSFVHCVTARRFFLP